MLKVPLDLNQSTKINPSEMHLHPAIDSIAE